MRRQALALFLLIPTIVLSAEKGTFRLSSGSSQATATVQNLSRTVLDIEITGLDYEKETLSGIDKYRIDLPEEFGLSRGGYLGPDNSVLPTITRLVAVPFDCAPTFRLLSSESAEIPGITLQTADNEALEGLASSLGKEMPLVYGEVAGQLRDLRLYAITVSPLVYDPAARTLKIYRHVEIEVTHQGTQIAKFGDHVSEAFLPVYRAIVDNPAVFDPIQPTRGAYWIFYPDAFESNIQPLVQWQKAKGFAVVTIPRTISGNNYNAMKNYIQTRFDSCLVKPDYITIMGDVVMPNSNGMPTYEYGNPYGFGDIESDNAFTFLQGDDYFPEVLIGRISFDFNNDITNYFNKLFRYARNPDMSDTSAYLRAVVVAGSDGYSFLSPRITKLWCREAMMQHGFIRVDTFFNSNTQPSAINAPINDGVGYVNYRGYGDPNGWTPPDYNVSNINQLANAPMFPIMTSIVCGTGDYNDPVDNCFGETWIRASNKGGSGFIGNSNHDAHTRWTNAIDVGIYWGLFIDNVTTIAQAQLMGKIVLYNSFPNDRSRNGEVELYFNSYNILGDPEINCWTAVPMPMNVSFPDSVAFGQNRVDVHIQDASGTPVENAVVCLWKEGEIFTVGFTGPDGDHNFTASPATLGDMTITATARGFIPLEDTITYYIDPVTVGYSSHVVDDDSDGESQGDGDGTFNPSERVEFRVNLANYGISDTAFGVTANLICQAPGITISRSSASYLDIPPSQTAAPDRPFFVRVGPAVPNGTTAPFILEISDINGHNWQGIIRLPILAPQMSFDSIQVSGGDGDTLIEPGETCDIVVTARNIGPKSLLSSTAIIRSADPIVHISDSTAVMGNCPPGETVNNASDHFTVSVDSSAFPGRLLHFEVEFTGLGPQVASTSFTREAGRLTAHDPIGPDRYGYYCYDNTDTIYSDYPRYNWVDIDIVNWSRVTLSDDDVATIRLPFDVRYYGQTYDSVTICDNGYVAMGETWYANFYNAPIPAPQDAEAMIAPFWDDISQNPLRVYYHTDTTNAWFIIGWKNALDGDNGRNQTFEIIFLDENYWPTVTHDNEIIFQYYTASSPTTMSAGICSPDRTDGIGYVFNNVYARGAATVVNGRAIKFTTGSLYITGADDTPRPSQFELSQNYPNPFNASTTIEFTIPTREQVSLEIYNVLGQKVSTLANGMFEAGAHSLIWNASEQASGIYFYRIWTSEGIVTRRMALLK